MGEFEMIQKLLEDSMKRIETMIQEIKKDIDGLYNDRNSINLKVANLEYRIQTIENIKDKKDNRTWQYLMPVISSLTISLITFIVIRVLK